MVKVLDSIIIEAGLAEIGADIRLKKSGIHNFILLERNDEMGGVLGEIIPILAAPVLSLLFYIPILLIEG